MEQNYLLPKPGDIIICQDNIGKEYTYLVDFAIEEREWIGAYRILDPRSQVMEQFIKNDKLFIPGKYLGHARMNKAIGGYVNIFSGKSAIHRKNIVEIVGPVPKFIYMNIVGAVISMMIGNFYIDGEKKLMLDDLSIDVKVPISISTILQYSLGLNVEAKAELADDELKTKIETDNSAKRLAKQQKKFDEAVAEVRATSNRFSDKLPVVYISKIVQGKASKLSVKNYILNKEEMEEIAKKSITEISTTKYEQWCGNFCCPTGPSAKNLKEAAEFCLKFMK